MGVNGTGQIYKGFTFDGIKSKDYGVYITGEGVYNAPVRDVEMITIPNRNGSFVLDHGRFENIEVTYPAGMFGATQTDFADGINALRNALASRKGYVRLEDEYNPDEYRMAVYQRGLEVSPAHYSQAGEFEITFNCKPQRFLKSGEIDGTVLNNEIITNPTLFESRPLLSAIGYGDLAINGETMRIYAVPMGIIPIGYDYEKHSGTSADIIFDTTNLVSGDDVYLYDALSIVYVKGYAAITDWDRVSKTGNGEVWGTRNSSNQILVRIRYNPFSFKYGTAKTETTTAVYYFANSSQRSDFTLTFALAYDGNQTINATHNLTVTGNLEYESGGGTSYGTMQANSTKPAVDNNPIYIDLDIGEAYKIDNGEIVPVNNAVTIPAELPTLKPGSNIITKDNTITQLKITPRWWRV